MSIHAKDAMQPFHVSLPVNTTKGLKDFYTDILGGTVLTENETEMSVDVHGHSIVLRAYEKYTVPVSPIEHFEVEGSGYDGHAHHMGIIVTPEIWKNMVTRIEKLGVKILVPAFVKNKGDKNETGFIMIADPAGYAWHISYTTDVWRTIRDDR